MRALLACFCAVAGSGPLFSQPHSSGMPAAHPMQFVSPVISRPLGGVQGAPSPVISRPLGGVALPTFPGMPPMKKQGMRQNSNYRYVGPVYYVPNAFDYGSSYYGSPYDQPLAPPPPPPIIGSYYEPEPEPAPAVTQEARVRPGDPISEPQNYYLIEYKDHSIYSALAYWIEGDTLHYVTTQNTHNQASLSLIDLEKTAKLNEDRSVPFSIPGR
ncbi:MAG TPA: hypothetical protein VKB79_16190 [Bryobacteraceae bacterium]|nr:hypothetical protein [Bryobacteraceae bacterium]